MYSMTDFTLLADLHMSVACTALKSKGNMRSCRGQPYLCLQVMLHRQRHSLQPKISPNPVGWPLIASIANNHLINHCAGHLMCCRFKLHK